MQTALSSERSRKRQRAGRLLPARLGEYELFDHIGRGGMADIYRARKSTHLGAVRQVVIKEILPELAESERLSELLAEEARTASRLEHKNVVRIEDLQRENGKLFIAMEYVEGVDLRELLRGCSKSRERLPLELSLRIVLEVLRALDYAHAFHFTERDGAERTGIVHRDVSPSNVLLSFEGEVKLCDFGIAKGYDSTTEEDDLGTGVFEGMVEGKAGYMSPEQARGEALDGRADVFAAGIILWELLSGRKLYKAGPSESLFDVARRGMVPPLPSMGYPNEGELRTILQTALSYERKGRFETATQFAEALTRYAKSVDVKPSGAKLRQFLATHFEPKHREDRVRRELATHALSEGPLASVLPIEPAPPRLTLDLTPHGPPVDLVSSSQGTGDARSIPMVRAPQRRAIWGAIVLCAVLAISLTVAFFVAR